MEQKLYCSQCGTKLNSNAKFCHVCGAKTNKQKIEIIQNEIIDNEKTSQRLYKQYRDIICNKITSSFCSQTTPAVNLLYQNGISYGFTKEMVDNVIIEQNKAIDRYVKYLESLYINGTLIIPDCSWRMRNECLDFGENLGLSEDEAHNIYYSFLEKNQIDDKFLTILAQIKNYDKKGMIGFDSIPANEAMDNNDFYVKFSNALSQFMQFQDTLHKESGSNILSNKDIDKLYQKAEEIGFYNIPANPNSEDSVNINIIDKLINGNEVRLGYAIKENEKMFSSIIPFQTIHLFGEDICFQSSYFLDKYIDQTVKSAINNKKENFIEHLQKVSDNINSSTTGSYIKLLDGPIRSMWKTAFLAIREKLPIDDETKKELKFYVKSASNKYFDYVASFLEEFGEIFDEINEGLESDIFQKELNRATRGRWSGGGFGLKGAVKGAVTASALNAGTGLAYGLSNSISISRAKSKAEKQKSKLFIEILNTIDKLINIIPQEIVPHIHEFLFDKYALSYTNDNPIKAEEIYKKYLSESNKLEKKKLASNLIKLNPNCVQYYEPLLEQTLTEPEDQIRDTVTTISKISTLFNVNIEQVKTNFENSEKEKILHDYPKDDINRCEMLLKLENILEHKTDIHNEVLNDFILNNATLNQKQYTKDELCDIVEFLIDFSMRFSFPINDVIITKAEEFIQHQIENANEITPEQINTILDDVKSICGKNPKLKQRIIDTCMQKWESYLLNYNKTSLKDYSFDELCSVIDELKDIGNKFSYSTKKIIEKRLNQLLDYHIRNDLKEYTAIKIDSLFYNIDLLSEKYPENKTLLENAKKRVIDLIFKHYKIDLKTVIKSKIEHNIENLEYIDQNFSFDFSTFLKKEISKLNKINEDEELESRTAFGVIYDTSEEAKNVKEEMYNLEKIMNEKSISYALRFSKAIQYDFKSEKVKNEIKKYETDLIKHIENIKNKANPSSSFGKLLIALLLTPVIGRIGLLFRTVGAIIAFIVIFGIWSWYIDEYKECKENNSLSKIYREEIREFEKLFIVKDGCIIKRQ